MWLELITFVLDTHNVVYCIVSEGVESNRPFLEFLGGFNPKNTGGGGLQSALTLYIIRYYVLELLTPLPLEKLLLIELYKNLNYMRYN